MDTSIHKKSKRTLAWLSVLLVILGIAGGYGAYRCFHPSRQQVQAAKARIEAYSCYELRKNGKTVLRFDESTTTLAAVFVNRWSLLPSCQGKLVANYNSALLKNHYKGLDADSVLEQRVDSLDSLYKDSKWKESELRYYIHSHNVTDMGYNRICAYENREKLLRDSAKKLLDSLHHIQGLNIDGQTAPPQGANLELVHLIIYKAFYRDKQGKEVSEKCQLIPSTKQTKKEGCYLFQLKSEKTPDGIFGLAPCTAIGIVKLQGAMQRKSINYNLLTDSLGSYDGGYDSTYTATGYGKWQGFDGTYYEGYWNDGKREGFGFSIGPKKPLRVGEWKADRYKGERLIYTSQRIYGIDISKYQHQQGKKRYGIDWSRLRITHLGNISKKTVTGNVNFPIRFIYIKSTEGKSLVNPYYKQDYKAARAHGYKVGTYHFFSTISPAALQANHFLRHSNIRKGDFPPVLDLEPFPSQIKKMGGTGVLFARVRTWLRLVERATGVKPILYISQTFVNRYLPAAPDLKRDYQVWIARYGEYKPDIHLIYWQLCPDGRVSGIHGTVDINVFNGYQEAFNKFARDEAIR